MLCHVPFPGFWMVADCGHGGGDSPMFDSREQARAWATERGLILA